MATILRNASETTLYDESCPLLANPDNPGAQKHFQPQPTPLPKGQLAALCSVRLVDPVAFTQVVELAVHPHALLMLHPGFPVHQ